MLNRLKLLQDKALHLNGGGELSHSKAFRDFITLKRVGFTLAEMLVVMLILTIIMAAFAPLMTKRKSVDVTSSPWQWASNNSDTYFGTGDSQTAIIGQSSKDSDDNARLSITPGASNQKHILLKDTSGDYLGKIHMYNTSMDIGGYESVAPLYAGNTNIGIEAGPGNGSSSNTYNTAVGYQSGYGMSGGYNTLLGYRSGYGVSGSAYYNTLLGALTGNGISGNHNIVAGYNAGKDVTGGQNILAGQEAGDSIIGSYNIAAGYRAGYKSGSSSSNANYNVAAGYQAGYNTSGSHNIAAGYHAGYYTSGNQNIAIGYQANHYSSGDGNIGIGYQAGGGRTQTSTSGNYNTAVGYSTGPAITSGGYNTAVGFDAAYKLTTGNYNTAVGYQACPGVTTGSYKTCIGYNSGPSDSGIWPTNDDKIVFLGSTGSTVYIPGNLVVGGRAFVGTLLGSAKTEAQNALFYNTQRGWHVAYGYNDSKDKDSAGITLSDYLTNSTYYSSSAYVVSSSYAISSDKRLKNIKGENKSGLEQIRSLKVYDYTFKKDTEKTPQVGVIAQDLQKVFPNAVKKDEEGYLLIRRDEIFYALVNAVKQLDLLINGVIGELKSAVYRISVHDTEIKKLKKENEELKKQNLNLEKRIERLEKAMN